MTNWYDHDTHKPSLGTIKFNWWSPMYLGKTTFCHRWSRFGVGVGAKTENTPNPLKCRCHIQAVDSIDPISLCRSVLVYMIFPDYKKGFLTFIIGFDLIWFWFCIFKWSLWICYIQKTSRSKRKACLFATICSSYYLNNSIMQHEYKQKRQAHFVVPFVAYMKFFD